MSIFSEKLEQAKKEILGFKSGILNPAKEYNEKHKKEISENTEKIKLLLQEGAKLGKNKEQVLQENVLNKRDENGRPVFIPTEDTPVLNFLHYIMNEYESKDDEYKERNQEKDLWDKTYAKEWLDKDEDYGVSKLEDITKSMFNGIDLETFNKLKKLKKLSTSDNENEASSSYKKCKDLCDKYNINYDQLPQ